METREEHTDEMDFASVVPESAMPEGRTWVQVEDDGRVYRGEIAYSRDEEGNLIARGILAFVPPDERW